ncbi:MAG: alpha/beta fold hydrolase [Betaproteobacteria bacterium]|nr:alpha/beta fold hydrolase [Betaproteobacteria bacterium]
MSAPAMAAPTLLFLPGTLCDERLWAHQMEALSLLANVACADYRHETSIDAMARAALAAVDGPVIPIGLSMGGMVAAAMVRLAPDRVVAASLWDTDPEADSALRRALREEGLAQLRNGQSMRVYARETLVPRYFSPAELERRASKDLLAIADLGAIMAADQGIDAYAAQSAALAGRAEFWTTLRQIGVPLLIGCGAADPICPVEMHRTMAFAVNPGWCRLATIDGAGHIPPLTAAPAVSAHLHDWLAQIALHALPHKNSCNSAQLVGTI